MNKRKALRYENHAIRSFLKALRKKRARNTFLTENGAIDIASIMIAVMVISLIATLVATTVFVVIPWAQDMAAKNQLKSIMAAQQAYAGMAATEVAAGGPVGSLAAAARLQVSMGAHENGKYYGDLTNLIEADMFDPAFLPPDAADKIYGEQVLAPDNSICIIKLEAGRGYEAAVRSASGNIFVTNDGWEGPVKFPDTALVCRGRVLGDYANYEDKVTNPSTNPSPTPTATETPYTAPNNGEVGGEHQEVEEEYGEDEPVEFPFPEATTPTETPTVAPSPTPSATPTATATATPTVTPTSAPTVAPVVTVIPDIPAVNKNPSTKKFMFCHMGAMHSNNFNGMVNGHHGHNEDIMPPIPFKNYAGWNWNAQTAKIYYNNCKPV